MDYLIILTHLLPHFQNKTYPWLNVFNKGRKLWPQRVDPKPIRYLFLNAMTTTVRLLKYNVITRLTIAGVCPLTMANPCPGLQPKMANPNVKVSSDFIYISNSCKLNMYPFIRPFIHHLLDLIIRSIIYLFIYTSIYLFIYSSIYLFVISRNSVFHISIIYVCVYITLSFGWEFVHKQTHADVKLFTLWCNTLVFCLCSTVLNIVKLLLTQLNSVTIKPITSAVCLPLKTC